VLTREQFIAWQLMVPGIFIGEQVKGYLVALANAIRGDARCLAPPSPRSVLMLARVAQAHAMAEGRDFVSPVDVQKVAPDVLAHRLIISGDDTGHAYVGEMINKVRVPA
jgi:MoxR-like ATPase